MENLQSFLELSPAILFVVPMIVGLIEVFKRLGMTAKYAPLFSLVLGVVLMYLAPLGLVWQAVVIQGIIAGLSASGLYSGSKKTFE